MPPTHEQHVIVIVDDDEDVRESLADVLAAHGHRVFCARNGREALATLKNAIRDGLQPCLILLDLNMPVMNGREFRACQQTDPELRSIHVVAITSDWEARFDADVVLPKPIRLDRLMATVSQFC